MNYFIYIVFIMFIVLFNKSYAQSNKFNDSLTFSGQFSAWAGYNDNNEFPVQFGARYIPALNYEIKLNNYEHIDFETAVNTYGLFNFNPFNVSDNEGEISPYRAWARYSSKQFELRGGLQKINFGSASLLRPLMWFDKSDPRDPLQLAEGVWGLLSRYYMIKNANFWAWCLYGNKGPKAWEVSPTHYKFPELGGRLQLPFKKGEAALSYHFRKTDISRLIYNDTNKYIPSEYNIPENRIGLDGKWDIGPGIWFEGAWINKSENAGIYTNQEMLTTGTDYTFRIGNGLNVIFEQLLYSFDEKAFALSDIKYFPGLSVNYSLNIFNNLNAIIFYDAANKEFYNFINLSRKYNKFQFNLMVYLNPDNYKMPQKNDATYSLSGKGIRIMLVYKH